LIALALKTGLDARFESESLPRTDVIPFESEHRFMATLHHDHAGHGFIFLKGAPERVLELCAGQRQSSADRSLDSRLWHAAMEAAAGRGMRLLARKPAAAGRQVIDFTDVEAGGFTLLAVLGIADPPREEAIRAVAQCRAAGIRVRMITGDHAATASAIGAQLGLAEEARALTGVEIEAMDDEALKRVAADTAIFARASPEHKLRLVEALQANGEVVAMTGDGVNDAPALKRADVGVAMGMKGTEAAKEAAEMVLADDNFASIAAAVEEGRAIYDNLRKSIVFILPTNGGQAGVLVAAILLGLHQLPIIPVQILWVNLVTAVTLALALAFEPAEPDIMRRPPRDPREAIMTPFMLWRVAFVSLLPVALATGLGQLGFTIFFGFALILLMGKSVMEALYVAVALTFSSTIIIIKLLSDKCELDALHGRIAVGFLIVQDLAVVLTMMGMSALRGGGEVGLVEIVFSLVWRVTAAFALLYVVMRHVLPRVVALMARSQELLLIFAIAWGTGLAALGEWAGFSKEAGAFLAGFSLASTAYRDAINARLAGIRDFLLLFFFIDLGAKLDFATLGGELWPAVVLSLFVLVGNPLIVMAIMGYMGYRKRTGFLAGLTVTQISEFSIIFVAMGIWDAPRRVGRALRRRHGRQHSRELAPVGDSLGREHPPGPDLESGSVASAAGTSLQSRGGHRGSRGKGRFGAQAGGRPRPSSTPCATLSITPWKR
jgi:phosphoserine phosphatase